MKKRVYEQYGECIRCQRYLKLDCLIQIENYKGHILPGSFHHKLICITCKELADEASEQMLKENRFFVKYGDINQKEADIKVGLTD